MLSCMACQGALHLKFLIFDILTNERKSIDQPSISPACDLCDAPLDSIDHVLSSFGATSDVRNRLFPELMNVVKQVQPMSQILQCHPPAPILTQFILDCSSLNLPSSIRIQNTHPDICFIVKACGDLCHAVHKERLRLLKALGHLKKHR